MVIKTTGMLEKLGKENVLNADDYCSISTPCLLLLGCRDKRGTLDETPWCI